MNRDNNKYSITWPINQPTFIGPGILAKRIKVPVTIYINTSSTSWKQRDKFDKDLLRIARTDLIDK